MSATARPFLPSLRVTTGFHFPGRQWKPAGSSLNYNILMKSQAPWSRRAFLAAVSGAGASMLLHPLAAWAIDEADPRVAALVAATIGIDTHNHIDVPLAAAEVPGPILDLAGELKRSG